MKKKIASVFLSVMLISCDVDVFGFNKRSIAGPYYLVRIDGECCYVSKGSSSGTLDGKIRSIGWTDKFVVIEYDSGKLSLLALGDNKEMEIAVNQRMRILSSTERRPVDDVWQSLR